MGIIRQYSLHLRRIIVKYVYVTCDQASFFRRSAKEKQRETRRSVGGQSGFYSEARKSTDRHSRVAILSRSSEKITPDRRLMYTRHYKHCRCVHWFNCDYKYRIVFMKNLAKQVTALGGIYNSLLWHDLIFAVFLETKAETF